MSIQGHPPPTSLGLRSQPSRQPGRNKNMSAYDLKDEQLAENGCKSRWIWRFANAAAEWSIQGQHTDLALLKHRRRNILFRSLAGLGRFCFEAFGNCRAAILMLTYLNIRPARRSIPEPRAILRRHHYSRTRKARLAGHGKSLCQMDLDSWPRRLPS